MSFKPGDHVSIFPANNVKLVSTLLNKLHNAPQPDEALTMQTCREESGKHLNVYAILRDDE